MCQSPAWTNTNSPLFAGITAINAKAPAPNDNRLRLVVTSDLPFQYQVKVLDANRLQLTLFNAQLSQALMQTPAQSWHLPKSSVQSIHIHPAETIPATAQSKDPATLQQTILLEGPGLGKKQLVLDGQATRVDISAEPAEQTLQTANNTPVSPPPSLSANKPPNSSAAPVALAAIPYQQTSLAAKQQGVLSEAEYGSRVRIQRYLQQALAAYEQGRYSQAGEAIESAIALDGSDPKLYAAQGDIDLQAGSYAKAVTSYENAIALLVNGGAPYTATEMLPYLTAYMKALYLAKDRSSTIEKLTYLLGTGLLNEQSLRYPILFTLGTVYQEMGQSDKALGYLKQAEAIQPQSGDLQFNLGLAYELLGHTKEARVHYQEAARLNPNAADIQQALGRIR